MYTIKQTSENTYTILENSRVLSYGNIFIMTTSDEEHVNNILGKTSASLEEFLIRIETFLEAKNNLSFEVPKKTVFISDIHYQTWKGEASNNELIKTGSDLRKALKLGEFGGNEYSYEIRLIFGGDIYNFLDFDKGIEGARKEAGFNLTKHFKRIKTILEESGDRITEVHFGIGNHEYYHGGVYDGYYSRKDALKDSLDIIYEIAGQVFDGVKIFSIDESKSQSIYSCVLYSPVLGLGEYNGVDGFYDKIENKEPHLSKEIGARINDFKFFNTFSDDFEIEVDSLKGLVEDRLLNDYKSIIKQYKFNTTHKIPELTLCHLQFFHDVFEFLKEVKGEELILNFHFPFDHRKMITYGMLEKNNYQDIGKINLHYNPESEINGWYVIDPTWFEWLIEKIQIKNPGVKKITFLHGHTHDNYRFETEYKGIEMLIINNCLGYGN